MHFGKTPIFVLVAGGLLGTLGFASLLFSLTGHSKQAMAPNLASHAVIAGLASDGVPSSATGTPDGTPTAVPTATPGVPSVKGLQVWAGGDSVGAFVAQNFGGGRRERRLLHDQRQHHGRRQHLLLLEDLDRALSPRLF